MSLHRNMLIGILLLGLAAGGGGCSDDAASDDDAGVGPDGSCGAETFAQPKSFTRYDAVLVTSRSLRGALQPLATFHTLTGTPTQVVTVEEICEQAACDDTDPRYDTAKAVKNYLAAQPGLLYAVLGGDIDEVPSRLTHDRYDNQVAGTFEEDFYTDYYYSDLSEWDSNGDGVYGDAITDSPDYRPELSVSRIPVSNPVEARRYVEKVIAYTTRFEPSHVQRALFLANLAGSGMGMDINSARYFEEPGRTLDLMPDGFTITKLYAQSDSPDPAAGDVTAANQVQEIEAGTNLVVHAGHGYPDLLTTEQYADPVYEFTGEMAFQLVNTTYPIFLSGACQAGQFEAPFIWHSANGDFQFTEDAAGERLINAPDGGAVAYVGNTTTGLGLAGGSQFIDEAIRTIAEQPGLLLADAIVEAHATLPESDTFPVPILGDYPVVDEDSYRWTQKAVVLLGDGLIPVWSAPRSAAPEITATTEPYCDGVRVHVEVSSTDVDRVWVGAGEDVYELALTDGAGTIAIDNAVDPIVVAAPSDTTFYLYGEAQ